MRQSLLLLLSAYLFLKCSNPKNAESDSKLIAGETAVYTSAEAEEGAAIYNTQCAACHGRDLRGTEGGNALIGERFLSRWEQASLGELFTLTQSTMPKSNPRSLDDESVTRLLAYILKANEFPSGDKKLATRAEALQNIITGSPPTSRYSSAFSPKPYQKTIPTIEGDWKQHRGDYASTNYSPLDQINKDNVSKLKIAWRWKTDNFGPSPEFYFKVTPLMVNGVLYTTAGLSRSVVALDAQTGETLWMYRIDEGERTSYVPRQNSGRGVAWWSSPEGKGRIIYITPGFQLIALDADTGRPVTGFGDNGVIDLKKGLGSHVDPITSTIGSTSPPLIVNDVIVIGSSFPVGLAPVSKKQVRGDILGYDVRTGKKLWTFHTIPQEGEEGNETWLNDSWTYTGNAAVWAPLTADPELGYVYLPIEAATGDFYGGHRPGNNLFSQSLVCLDIKTGKKVWHYQLIHHDIWDYDTPAPPILADITVDGKSVKSVIQVTKQAFAYVFDRITGKPVWPIEERPVPKSDVPGEWTSPTQPIPTRPAPFDLQGFSEDMLVDFTPEIKKEALEIVRKYKTGPLYTPVSVYDPPRHLGTLILPDAVGGANWQGGVFDPETQTLFVSSSTVLRPMSLAKAPELSDMDFVAYMGSARIGPHGLPLLKPPYGRITAINMNTGDHMWMAPNADSPSWIKNNPGLKGLNIPPTGLPDRVGMLVTKTLLFAGEGSGLYGSDGGGGKMFRALDKSTGQVLATIELPANQCGLPMTYSINGKQYIVVAVGAIGHAGELVALTIPGSLD